PRCAARCSCPLTCAHNARTLMLRASCHELGGQAVRRPTGSGNVGEYGPPSTRECAAPASPDSPDALASGRACLTRPCPRHVPPHPPTWDRRLAPGQCTCLLSPSVLASGACGLTRLRHMARGDCSPQ